jgi:Zn-dependent protease
MSIITLAILIISIVAHEVAHGVAALWQGDPTAKHAGRLTLNPISHIDMVGSIIVPLLCVISQIGFVFGWAKPVPINPYNFRNQRWGEAMVAAAGPLTNMAIVAVFTVLIKVSDLGTGFYELAVTAIVINTVLAIFNLIPVPPLDGSKILFAVLPQKYYRFKTWVEEKGFIISLIIALFAWRFIVPVVFWFINLLIG